jgi:Mycolic acid cyclopropane synthetase
MAAVVAELAPRHPRRSGCARPRTADRTRTSETCWVLAQVAAPEVAWLCVVDADIMADPHLIVGGVAAVGGEFSDCRVFSGSPLPPRSRVLVEITCSQLEAADVKDLRPRHTRTLRRWKADLEARRDKAIAPAGAEHYRVWGVHPRGRGRGLRCWRVSMVQVLASESAAGCPAPRRQTTLPISGAPSRLEPESAQAYPAERQTWAVAGTRPE